MIYTVPRIVLMLETCGPSNAAALRIDVACGGRNALLKADMVPYQGRESAQDRNDGRNDRVNVVYDLRDQGDGRIYWQHRAILSFIGFNSALARLTAETEIFTYC